MLHLLKKLRKYFSLFMSFNCCRDTKLTISHVFYRIFLNGVPILNYASKDAIVHTLRKNSNKNEAHFFFLVKQVYKMLKDVTLSLNYRFSVWRFPIQLRSILMHTGLSSHWIHCLVTLFFFILLQLLKCVNRDRKLQ